MDLLLRGLLARDRRQRWQWKEVQAWLAGEAVSAPEGPRPADSEGRASITLGGKQYRSAGSFALAAAEAANWDEAKGLLLRGAIATWATEAGFEARLPAALRQFVRAEELNEDLRLSISLKSLNPAMPLIVRGNIVTPGWLLDHPDDGYPPGYYAALLLDPDGNNIEAVCRAFERRKSYLRSRLRTSDTGSMRPLHFPLPSGSTWRFFDDLHQNQVWSIRVAA